jgi:hypothetical protein
MEDKLFEMMTQMYSDLTTKLDSINDKLDGKAGKEDIVRIENIFDDNSRSLFDGYKMTYEKLGIIEEKVDEISQKVERQDVEIKVIKGSK